MPIEDGWGDAPCCDTQTVTQLGWGGGGLGMRWANAEVTAAQPDQILLTGGNGDTQPGDSGGPILARLRADQPNQVPGSNYRFGIVGIHQGTSTNRFDTTIANRITPAVRDWINDQIATENSRRIRAGIATAAALVAAAIFLEFTTGTTLCRAPGDLWIREAFSCRADFRAGCVLNAIEP
jgi:hypothetical protein